ncbi:MAG: hypothetical protein LUI39_06220 [Lachnospiraceae bacterium]|nr:hypothetical protein [Lachnospiraceae bacterium]
MEDLLVAKKRLPWYTSEAKKRKETSGMRKRQGTSSLCANGMLLLIYYQERRALYGTF